MSARSPSFGAIDPFPRGLLLPACTPLSNLKSRFILCMQYAIMRRCGIPARDLRILDPLLAYPSTILGREKAIVVNLEAIKAIITADEVGPY